jgi:hypothetical protein
MDPAATGTVTGKKNPKDGDTKAEKVSEAMK